MGGKSAVLDVGRTFGKLTVVSVDTSSRGKAVVHASCACGGTWVGSITPLRSGGTTSCGCVGTAKLVKRNTTHGLSKLPEYSIWKGMRRRCYDPRHKDYPTYGGKGVRVCDEWANFSTFLRDVGRRPRNDMSIDRKDSDGDYEPNNCKWSTVVEQARNTSRNKRYEYRGELLTLGEISEQCGIPYYTLRSRVYSGWSIEASTTVPIAKSRAGEIIEHKGEALTLSQWARKLEMGVTTLAYRLKAGWPLSEALSERKTK